MQQRSMFWCGLALAFALLTGPAVVYAGGVYVILDAVPQGVQPGQEFTVGFTVRSMHDNSASNDLQPSVVLTRASASAKQRVAGVAAPLLKERITVLASPQGPTGHYVAQITLPEAGRWQWEIYPFGTRAEYPASVMSPLEVGTLAPQAQPTLWPAPLAGLLTLAAVAAVATSAWLLLRVRRRATVQP